MSSSDLHGSRVRSVPTASIGLEDFRNAGVVSSGVDERLSWQLWGEGLSPTHLLFWVTRGHLGVRLGTSAVFATAGQVLFVPPCCAKLLFTEDEPLRGLWLHARDAACWGMLRGTGPVVRQSVCVERIDPLFESILAESHGHDRDSSEACRLLARALLHYVRREVGSERDPFQRETRERLAELWQAMNANLAATWSLTWMASRLHISVGHCHRLVLQQYGITPMQMLRKLRLERAAELLLSSDATLDRIAQLVGYGSAYALSKAFLKHFGQRPGAYRRTCCGAGRGRR